MRAEGDVADARANEQASRTAIPITAAATASQLETTQAEVTSAQRGVDAAKATQQQAEANYTKVATDLERYKTLFAKDEVSRQQYDAAIAAEKSARADVESARAAVAANESKVVQAQAAVRSARTAPAQVQVTEAHAGSASASVKTREAALEQAKLNVGYTVLTSPVDGFVTRKTVEVGQTLQAGQPLMTIVPLSNVWVIANYKETQLKNMRVGQSVKIQVDALDKEFEGTVQSIGGTTGAKMSVLPPENATGNYVKVVQRVPVKITLKPGQDPEQRLRPGMSVEPVVLTQ
jgi:membrane fusion protein (multidrug efflux system)